MIKRRAKADLSSKFKVLVALFLFLLTVKWISGVVEGTVLADAEVSVASTAAFTSKGDTPISPFAGTARVRGMRLVPELLGAGFTAFPLLEQPVVKTRIHRAIDLVSNSSLVPGLGNYSNTNVVLGKNTTIMPSAAPTNTTQINVSASGGFNGVLEANPVTGIVRVTNAHPAGAHTVTVTAFDLSGFTASRTFTLTVADGAFCTAGVQFTNGANVGAGNRPASVAIGDFNRDGNQDVAIANFGSNNVSIRLGDGLGGFGGATDVGVGNAPVSVAVGDINNDGSQDFVAANQNSGSISIRLGNGAGGFTGTTNLSVGSFPQALALADFNHDGKLDYALSVGSNIVTVRLGDGVGGGFTGTTDVGVGSNPVGVAIGDFNRDGNPDFASANFISSSVSIRMGNGSGGFSGTANVGVGTQPFSVAIADFNNDGRQDLASADRDSDTVSIRIGDGLGGFSGTTTVNVGDAPASVATADFNNDGNEDFATANQTGDSVSIRLGNGLGGFSAPGDFIVGDSAYSVAVGDFNNDGRQDFAVANLLASSASIRLGTCGLTPSPTPTPTPVPTPTPPPTITPSPTPTPGGCVASIAPFDGRSFDLNGGTGTVYIEAAPDCRWVLASDAPWITFTPSASGSGVGTAGYQVAANSTGAPRTGSISVAGSNRSLGDSVEIESVVGITQFATSPVITIEDASIEEGDNPAGALDLRFAVHLSYPHNVAVTVAYSTADGTAVDGSEYFGSVGLVTFDPGSTEEFITIGTRGDLNIEATESFVVNLGSPTNSTIGRNQAVGTIYDNDTPVVTLAGNSSVVEGNAGQRDMIFRVTLSRPVNAEVSVGYATTASNFGPVPGVDFTDVRRRITIPANTLEATIPITVFGDSEVEGHEEFGLFLDNPTNATLGRESFRGTIVNDDGPRTLSIRSQSATTKQRSPSQLPITVFLTAASDEEVSVGYFTADGTALSGRDYAAVADRTVFSPGQFEKVVNIPIFADNDIFVVDDERIFLLSLTQPSGAAINPQLQTTIITVHDFFPSYCDLFPALVTGCIEVVQCTLDISSPDDKIPDLARQFRDKVLAKSSRGRKYTKDYYQYTGEVVRQMVFSPRLLWRINALMEKHVPTMEALVSRERAAEGGDPRPEMTVLQSDLNEVDDLLSSIGSRSSEELRAFLDNVRRDMRDPVAHAEFGVRVQMDAPVAASPLDTIETKERLAESLPDRASNPETFVFFPRLLESADQHGTDNGQLAAAFEPPTDSRPVPPTDDVYGNVALTFEANRGQAAEDVDFISRGNGYTLALSPTESVMALRDKSKVRSPRSKVHNPNSGVESLTTLDVEHETWDPDIVRMKLVGANAAAEAKGLDELPSRSNYLIGDDAAEWRKGVPNFGRVKYDAVYPGIDLVYYGKQRQLEYDFLIAPGSDPAVICMEFTGAEKLEIDASGDLILHTENGEVRMRAPVTYQEIDGVRHAVASRYVFRKNPKSKIQNPKSTEVGFEIGDYDGSRPLVIDPVLVYSTYLGGRGEDKGNTITVDAAGNAYIIGFTDSVNFPVANPRQSANGGRPQDVFVAKLNAAGTGLVYSTYLGGDGQDHGSAIAVDAAGNAYITGYTGSTNFPVANALQPQRTGGVNAFVAKLDPTGANLIYSTHLGGSSGEFGSGIAIDSDGSAYVTGVTTSTDFPRVNARQRVYGGGLADAFVTKLNPAGSALVFSTFLGGAGIDGAAGIAVDSNRNIHITGVTSSTNFPTSNAIQGTFRGGDLDAFVTKLDAAGTQLVYSTYLGGTDSDRGFRVATDTAGNAYVAGDTESSSFPVRRPIRDFHGGSDAFVAKLTPAGVMTYGTFLGGAGLDSAGAVAVDAAGNAYVTGYTESFNFPNTDPMAGSFGGGTNAFVTKLNAAGTAFSYSTYLGGGGKDGAFGIAVDSGGNAYVLGQTDSTNFPTRNPLQPANAGPSSDVFIVKIADSSGIGGLEGDLASRPSGDGLYLPNDLALVKLFFAGEPFDPASNEFQRADCAPYETRGDGNLNATDIQQIRNYIAVLSAPQAAGGPLAPPAIPSMFRTDADDAHEKSGRNLRIVSSEAAAGDKVTVAVELDSLGDEVGVSFTLNFDPALLGSPVVKMGSEVTEGTTLTTNATRLAKGQLGILVDSADALATHGTKTIVTIAFDVFPKAAPGPVRLAFNNSFVGSSISNAAARPLPTAYHNGVVMIRGR